MLYLASRSPRRADFLGLLGIDFKVVPADVDESREAQETPAEYVLRVALNKALTVQQALGPGAVILAADTTVTLNGQIFGKPADENDAILILSQLSGRRHQVLSAIVVLGPAGEAHTEVVTTEVELVNLDDATIKAYWASGEPQDKAGSYAIQGLGGAFVRRIHGSYSNVVGLPLHETRTLLRRVGITDSLTS